MPKGPPKIFIARFFLDSEEATIELRNCIAEAWFKFHNTRERFRASIPLERISKAQVETYLFGTDLLHLWVDTDEPTPREIKLAICAIGSTLEEQGLVEPFRDSFYRNWKDVKHQMAFHPHRKSPKPIMDIFLGPEYENGEESGRSKDSEWMKRTHTFNWALDEDEGEGVDEHEDDKQTKRRKLLAAAFQIADGELKSGKCCS
jgi:hypothetical protein